MRRIVNVLLLAACGSDQPPVEIAPDAGSDGKGDGSNTVCLAKTEVCDPGNDQCCDGYECGTTTLGQVCCGQTGAACDTPNGEDCCGQLLCIEGVCQLPESMFSAPFRCNERWTYSHHSAEVRRALDFIRDDGGATNGAPVLASAAGIATRHYQGGGAGNYVVIDHGGGWQTYYFHLSEFSVADGTAVARGAQIGLTGTTGASSGPHIHYEQLLNGVGQPIVLQGMSLEPYPGTYGSRSLTSTNECP